MKAVLTLWLTAFVLAACVAPQPQNTGPYEEDQVVKVTKYDSGGNEVRSWVPDQGVIVVDGDKVQFLDEKGNLITVEPSYSIQYNR